MTITYDAINYGAYVHNGKVKYYKEYSLNGCIMYTVGMTYKDYNEAVGG